jgi:hypothetical protein
VNANAVARHYARLTPEERFRLILAAGGRGDEAEQNRLKEAGTQVELSLPDHAPYAHAFDKLSLLVFIDLMEDGAHYLEAFVLDSVGADIPEAEVGNEGVGAKPRSSSAHQEHVWERRLDLALALGFVLRTKAEGWKLFCDRLSVPPFLVWEGVPGFDRLQRALALTEDAAFTPQGVVRWLKTIRPEGRPEATIQTLISAEMVADSLSEVFREFVDRWSE